MRLDKRVHDEDQRLWWPLPRACEGPGCVWSTRGTYVFPSSSLPSVGFSAWCWDLNSGPPVSSKQQTGASPALSSLFSTELFPAWARDGSDCSRDHIFFGIHEKYASIYSKSTKIILIGLYWDT